MVEGAGNVDEVLQVSALRDALALGAVSTGTRETVWHVFPPQAFTEKLLSTWLRALRDLLDTDLLSRKPLSLWTRLCCSRADVFFLHTYSHLCGITVMHMRK